MVVYYPLCLLYVVIFFPLYALFAGGKPALNRMLKYIFTPAVTAFATQSSAATLPVNKEACDAIGVPKDVSDLVLPMGCTMHMDGSVLSSIVKIAFLFGIFDMPFTGVGTYAMAIAVAILSAFVLSGAPGGGLVGEMLIVSMFGFPAEAFPLIATLGFLFDPAATCLNAAGDRGDDVVASSALGQQIVAYAKQFLGRPYVWGGNGPNSFDCSGFTKYVYTHFGYNINRTASAQLKNGVSVSRSELQAGDLVFFYNGKVSTPVSHVGIYIGNGDFIHASSNSYTVEISSLYAKNYDAKYVYARRII